MLLAVAYLQTKPAKLKSTHTFKPEERIIGMDDISF